MNDQVAQLIYWTEFWSKQLRISKGTIRYFLWGGQNWNRMIMQYKLLARKREIEKALESC